MIVLPRPSNKAAIAPSILSANQLILGAQIDEVTSLGADWLHIDIMDGHFVPNLSFGPATVKWIDTKTKLAQDVHLMVQTPQKYIESFIKAGASSLTLHEESDGDLRALLTQIKRAGLSCGLSIKPDTSAKALVPYLDLLDLVLVMTVYPGFGGQAFLDSAPQHIREVRQVIDGKNIWLEVDGGINLETAKIARSAGADAFVAGHALFGQKDISLAFKELKASLD